MIRFVRFMGVSGKTVYVSPDHVTCVIAKINGDDDEPCTQIYLDDCGEIPVEVKEYPLEVVQRLISVNNIGGLSG